MDEKIIDFIKGLMQPGITLMAIFILLYILVFGKTGAPFDELFWLGAGVVGFWFGKTVGLFGNGKAPTSTATTDTSKDNVIKGLTEVVRSQASTIDQASYNLANSVPNEVVEKVVGTPVVTATTTTAATVETPAAKSQEEPASTEPDINEVFEEAAYEAMTGESEGGK